MTTQLTFNLQPDRRALTVSELTARIRDLLAKNFTDLSVEGEISNCREAQSGHLYFTLKDEKAQIRCVWFKQDRRGLKFRVEDGLKSLCAAASAYTNSVANIRSMSKAWSRSASARCNSPSSN